MKNNKVLPGLILPLLATAAIAAGSFEIRDENNDGNISKNEWDSAAGEAGLFGEWDDNNDQWIDENEYSAQDYDYDFGGWDADADDRLDDNEFNDGWFRMFDENEDGHWDADEWDDARDSGVFDV